MDKNELRKTIKEEFKYYLENVARSARRTNDGYNLVESAINSYLSFVEPQKLFDYDPDKWSHIESIYDITDNNEAKEIADELFKDDRFVKRDTDNNKYWRSGSIQHYVCFLNARSFFKSQKGESKSNDSSSKALQIFFYGAPGTGKSYTIERETKGCAVVRTTFHPDSDYSTFVGAYKPVMDEVDVKVTPIVTNNGVSLQPSGIYKEKRIAYKFVKQAFLKAYLGAWKKYVDNGPKQNGVVVTASNGEKFILKEVGPDYVAYTKETQINITQFENNVKDYWNNNVSQDNKDNWKWFQQIVCLWYQERDDEEQSADKCWDAFTKDLKGENKSLSYSTSNQQYLITSDGNNIIIKTCKERKAGQNKIEEEFNKNGVTYISVQATIAKKLHDYGGTFEEAWGKLEKEVKEHLLSHSDAADSNGILPQFLIIEEINRGNCAQIFGDLFQLLDRGENKFSEYPIEADTDLQQEIAWAFKEEKEYKLSSNINIEGAVKSYTSNYGKTLSEDVQEGRVLLLPPNLYIWATMNTSDQSLFPIDSAFKRRWDWQYIPIANGNKNWRIEVNGLLYDWWDFLKKINFQIASTTNSEDKKLGYYFCKASNKVIDAKTFVGKVIFYLWNDVFKDYDLEGDLFKDDDNNKLTFDKFFSVQNGKTIINESKVELFLKNLGVEQLEEEIIDDEEGDDDSNDENNDSKSQRKSSNIEIYYDESKIDGKNSIVKFANLIEMIGVEKVVELGIIAIKKSSIALLSKDKLPEDTPGGYGKDMRQIGDYWMVTKYSNQTKISMINEIAGRLSLNLRAELI